MKIVVTGALGQIGSGLVRELPAVFPGAEIVMIDNFLTQRHCSLFGLPAAGRYRFIEKDVRTADLIHLFNGADSVVHLAAWTDAEGSFAARELVESINVEGTRHVAQACLKVGTPLLFASTSSVHIKISEQSPYAQSKFKAEQLLQTMAKEDGLSYALCRFGTVFGVSPGIRFHTAVHKFCWQAVMGQPVTVYRTALHQTRPYLDLRDAVGAMQFILQKRLFNGQTYDGVTTHATVEEILTVLSKLVPSLTVESVEAKSMTASSYTLCAQKLLQEGFCTRGDLREGIKNIVALLRSANAGSSCESIRS
ncbi:MAG: SDR family oxidoreductase [Candidatus Omnitrophica bacterium]|nr:SDR family oxidoreductase [Candidatus Omnitrophota bacterium]